MCFSAEVSFGASAVLTAVGIASLKKVRTRSQTAFACIPLIFAVQQFTEGFVWISVLKPGYLDHPQIPVYIFLIIAQIVWPVWVPFSLWCMEQDRSRKIALFILLVLGIFFAVYLIISLLQYPAHAEMKHLHIRYIQKVPPSMLIIGSCCYVAATVISLFIPKNNLIKFLGVIVLISFLISKLFFADNVVSVWCLFAALMSIDIYVILKRSTVKPPGKI